MTSPATPDTDPVPATTAGAGSSRAHRVPLFLAAGVLAVMLVRALLMQPYAVASDSMAPTLEEGQRVLVAKVGSPSIGDVVVADVTQAWPGPDRSTHTDDGLLGRVLGSASAAVGVDLGERSVLGRVVAGGGEDVVCCTAGRVTVDGAAVGPRLAGDAAPFRVTVPEGRYFLLSDTAAGAMDSRTHVGAGSATTDGTIAADAVIGTVVTRIWPLRQVGAPAAPTTTQP
ncbi:MULTISPECIES: signal peptidase I [unclassified Knoellia]|uniref:signal peptidase I n=1 Tax=Knoellia altitudinis TaxID=3404795 RepID=UPI00360C29FB